MGLLKTLFIITISTTRFIMPGVPATTGLAADAKTPAARSVTIDLASDVVANKASTATVTMPESINASKTVKLQMDLTGVMRASLVPTPSEDKYKVTSYWGSGESVSTGQPKVTEVGGTDPSDASGEARTTTTRMPDKSYAFWPDTTAKPLGNDAATPGAYALTTNYCGSTSVTLGQDQNFLQPIDVVGMDNEPDMAKPIVIKWKPVPNAVGYVVKAFGGGENGTISWTASAKPDAVLGIEYLPVSKENLDKYIKDGAILPAAATTCTIPAGIFKGSSSVMLALTAIGRDMIQNRGGIETQVIVRSTASIPLHVTPLVIPHTQSHRDKKVPNEE